MKSVVQSSIQNLDKLIEEISEKIRELLGERVVSIVLFGSLVRKPSFKPFKSKHSRSDLDFLIVLREVNPEVNERLSKLRLKYLLDGIRVDTVVLSVGDAMLNFSNPSPLFASLILGNVVLYDTGFFDENFREMVEMVKRSRIKFAEEGRIWDLARIASEITQ